MTLMAVARLIYLDSNLDTGGQAHARTHMHVHALAHTGVHILPVQSVLRQKARDSVRYNLIFKLKAEVQIQRHSINYFLMI